MTAAERLRKVAELLPPGAAVMVSREDLLDAFGAATGAPDEASMPRDYTVADLAEIFGRSESTIRAWLEAGRLPNAYKLRGREWRVPRASVQSFLERERKRFRGDMDLGAWRKLGCRGWSLVVVTGEIRRIPVT